MVDKMRRFPPERIGVALSLVLFGAPALLLWLTTRLMLPDLVARGWEPLLAWFAAGLLVFAPLLVAAVICASLALPTARGTTISEELRVHRLTPAHWLLTGSVLAFTIAGIACLHFVNARVWPGLPAHPSFMPVQPLRPEQHYILLLWLPFFAFNIIGEELWWRGFIQPRQEAVFGRNTWIVQGILHGAFHVSFGPGVLLLLLPVLFSIPWAVQRTRNTSVGMLIHAGVNGPGFVAVNLGLLPA